MEAIHYIVQRWVLALAFTGLVVFGTAQSLEIYQINITNGDAAVILTKNADGSIRKAVLIDGGQRSSEIILAPFLNEYVQHSHFDWVILSHYHDDHYKGLINLMKGELETCKINTPEGPKWMTCSVLIDPGGYDIDDPMEGAPYCSIQADYTFPKADNNWPMIPLKLTPDKKNLATNADGRYLPATWVKRYLQGVANMYGRNGFNHETPKDNQAYFEAPIVIDVLDNGAGISEAVTLKCVAMNSFNIKPDGSGFEAVREVPKSLNANNFSFAWVLEFGEFRFYTGGDLGGHSDGTYINQETAVAAYLHGTYPNSEPLTPPGGASPGKFPGHVCVYKANHHGSNESNYPDLLNTCVPSSFITSVGSNVGWHLPGQESLLRFFTTTVFNAQRNFLFTGLYAYPKDEIDLKSFEALNPDNKGTQDDLGFCISRREAVITATDMLPGALMGDQNHYKIEVKLAPVIGFPPEPHPISNASMYTIYCLPAPQKAKAQGPTTAMVKKSGLAADENKIVTIPILCHHKTK